MTSAEQEQQSVGPHLLGELPSVWLWREVVVCREGSRTLLSVSQELFCLVQLGRVLVSQDGKREGGVAAVSDFPAEVHSEGETGAMFPWTESSPSIWWCLERGCLLNRHRGSLA